MFYDYMIRTYPHTHTRVCALVFHQHWGHPGTAASPSNQFVMNVLHCQHEDLYRGLQHLPGISSLKSDFADNSCSQAKTGQFCRVLLEQNHSLVMYRLWLPACDQDPFHSLSLGLVQCFSKCGPGISGEPPGSSEVSVCVVIALILECCYTVEYSKCYVTLSL